MYRNLETKHVSHVYRLFSCTCLDTLHVAWRLGVVPEMKAHPYVEKSPESSFKRYGRDWRDIFILSLYIYGNYFLLLGSNYSHVYISRFRAYMTG